MMPTTPSPSKSGVPPGLVPQATRSSRKSVMPTLPSQSRSHGHDVDVSWTHTRGYTAIENGGSCPRQNGLSGRDKRRVPVQSRILQSRILQSRILQSRIPREEQVGQVRRPEVASS